MAGSGKPTCLASFTAPRRAGQRADPSELEPGGVGHACLVAGGIEAVGVGGDDRQENGQPEADERHEACANLTSAEPTEPKVPGR